MSSILHPERRDYAPGPQGAGAGAAPGPQGAGAGAAPGTTAQGAPYRPAVGAGAAGAASHLPGPAPTTAGPHRSDMLNKLDPRVDSDVSNPRSIETQVAAAQRGGQPGPAPNTAGPHRSDVMNKLDPRVDSDMSHTAPAAGAHHPHPGHPGMAAAVPGQAVAEGTYGSHQSHVGNALDPRADLDRAHAPGAVAGGQAYDHGPGPGAVPGETAGPHMSSTLNRLDPRVDDRPGGRAGPRVY